MLTETDVTEISRLYEAGLPLVEIANRVGYSRKTVVQVTGGKHPRRRGTALKRKQPSKRCPGCGGRYVTKTCMVCEVRGDA